jgi:hypothetical protein
MEIKPEGRNTVQEQGALLLNTRSSADARLTQHHGRVRTTHLRRHAQEQKRVVQVPRWVHDGSASTKVEPSKRLQVDPEHEMRRADPMTHQCVEDGGVAVEQHVLVAGI